MLAVEKQELLQRFAYQAWLERGKPIGSPEVDWARAEQMLRAHYSRGVDVLDAATKASDENISRSKVLRSKLTKNRADSSTVIRS